MATRLAAAFLLAALSACGAGAFAQPFSVDEVVPPKYLDELKAKGSVEHVHEKGEEDFLLLPDTGYSGMIRGGRVKKERDSYVAECLYFVKKSTLAENSAAGAEGADTSMRRTSEILRSVSKMKGMTYYSFSDKRRQTLYKEAYTFAGPENRAPVPDQTAGSADGQVSYAFQHDHTFGDCYYRLEYFERGNEMAAVFTNIDAITLFGIKAVAKEKLKINIVVVDCGDGYLIFLGADSDNAHVPFMRNRLVNSFRARIQAIYDWFIMQF